MENTGKVLFSGKDDQPVWFVALDHEKWVGPMAASEVLERIRSEEFTWAHYGWRKGQSQWNRLCDIPEFQVAVPALPNKILEIEVNRKVEGRSASRASRPPAPQTAEWFLYYNDSQFGPFTEADVHRFLRIGKIHGDVHVWKDGMKGWERIKSLSNFEESVDEAGKIRATRKTDSAGGRPAKPEKSERRKSPRFPVVARSLMASGEKVFSGVCRDVSIGGMQVLSAELPGPVGTRIQLNVSAPISAGKKIQSFVAKGVIVRELEDGRGFSFRFEDLSEQAVSCIEDYVRDSKGKG